IAFLFAQVPEPRPAARAEAPAVVRPDLALELEALARPLAVDRECAPGLLAAVGAMAPSDVKGLALGPIAHRATEAATCPHTVGVSRKTEVCRAFIVLEHPLATPIPLRTRFTMTARRRGATAECERRTQGASRAALRARPRTPARAGRRGPATQRFIVKRVL